MDYCQEEKAERVNKDKRRNNWLQQFSFKSGDVDLVAPAGGCGEKEKRPALNPTKPIYRYHRPHEA
jgi:hypothetical protein